MLPPQISVEFITLNVLVVLVLANVLVLVLVVEDDPQMLADVALTAPLPFQPEDTPQKPVPLVPIMLICCCPCDCDCECPCVWESDTPPRGSHEDCADANWPNAFEGWMDWAGAAGEGAAEKRERMSCLTSFAGGWGATGFEVGGAWKSREKRSSSTFCCGGCCCDCGDWDWDGAEDTGTRPATAAERSCLD